MSVSVGRSWHSYLQSCGCSIPRGATLAHAQRLCKLCQEALQMIAAGGRCAGCMQHADNTQPARSAPIPLVTAAPLQSQLCNCCSIQAAFL